jgi:hypothetical protein
MLELVSEKYAFTSLSAPSNAASVDFPEDDDTPVSGRRAPIFTVLAEIAFSCVPSVVSDEAKNVKRSTDQIDIRDGNKFATINRIDKTDSAARVKKIT